jgi:hypothetical protein
MEATKILSDGESKLGVIDRESLLHIDKHTTNLLKLLREIQEKNLLKFYNRILYDLEFEILQLNAELNRMLVYYEVT